MINKFNLKESINIYILIIKLLNSNRGFLFKKVIEIENLKKLLKIYLFFPFFTIIQSSVIFHGIYLNY